MSTTRMRDRQGAGPPVFTYQVAPGVLPVSARRLGRGTMDWPPGADHAHAHDFLVLVYFARGGGAMWLGDREWPLQTGDVYIIAPGEVVGAGVPGSLDTVEGWAVYFPPEVFGAGAPG